LFGEKKFMNWNTIYISGKPGFEKELQRKLDRADLPLMNGSSPLPDGTCLYWVAEQLPLRELKKAIGADLIWKYRLRFSAAIQEHSHEAEPFTEWEQKMIGKMTAKSKPREPIL
jgi:hypothetical protein